MTEIIFEIGAVDLRLRALVEQMESTQGFLKNAGEHLFNRTKESFAAQADPEGIPWQKLAPSTIAERRRLGLGPTPILRRGRRLPNLFGSLVMQLGDGQVAVGVAGSLPYARIHQFGGEVTRPAREGLVYRHVSWKPKGKAKGSGRFASPNKGRASSRANVWQKVSIPQASTRIPARPYLGVSAEDREAIVRIASDWIRVEHGAPL